MLFEKRILDGRNRAAACRKRWQNSRATLNLRGTREEALMFVVSHNLKRRHLNKQAIADTLGVEAGDFQLTLRAGPGGGRIGIKMSAQRLKTASSRG